MEKIYSKIQQEKLLHIITKFDEICERTEIVPENNFIQCASLKMQKGKTFRPHKHITKERHYKEQIAQESWVVIKGSVRCIFYDIDDSILVNRILSAGDASFTLYGGHTYEILDDNTIVYEYKTGPYEGQQLDKKFI
jgi:cupin fold WbuC family metalloprotein